MTVVWKLDRFGCSTLHLVKTLLKLKELGITFVTFPESMDFTGANKKSMYNLIAAIAQFEDDMITERIRTGLYIARSQGKQCGRSPISPYETKRISQLKKQGVPDQDIAAELDLTIGTIRRIYQKSQKTKKSLQN